MTTNTPDTPELGGDKLNQYKRRESKPMKRTIHRVEHYGQEYIVDEVLEQMNQGLKLTAAIKTAYPMVPKESVVSIAAKVKKHPYFQAYKEASLKLLHDKGAALQQNLLDMAFNARSEMVRYSATTDAMDRVFGKKDEDTSDNKPTMVFNFSFGDNTPPPKVTTQIIDGETV